MVMTPIAAAAWPRPRAAFWGPGIEPSSSAPRKTTTAPRGGVVFAASGMARKAAPVHQIVPDFWKDHKRHLEDEVFPAMFGDGEHERRRVKGEDMGMYGLRYRRGRVIVGDVAMYQSRSLRKVWLASARGLSKHRRVPSVLTGAVFPAYTSEAPILTFDFVSVDGGRGWLAHMDFVPVVEGEEYARRYLSQLEAIRSKCQRGAVYPRAMPLNRTFLDSQRWMSPGAIAIPARLQGDGQGVCPLATLPVFREVTSAYKAALREAEGRPADPEAVAWAHRGFQEHQAAQHPAATVFEGSMGTQWMDGLRERVILAESGGTRRGWYGEDVSVGRGDGLGLRGVDVLRLREEAERMVGEGILERHDAGSMSGSMFADN